jgi:hypothetical protein
LPAAIHVDIHVHRQPNAQVAQLRFLEIGVDPDVIERANRHQVLADLNIIARIDLPARHDAIDLRDDAAIAKVQFSLGEFLLGHVELGLGLLNSRSLRCDLGEDAVDVAGFFELREHLLWALVE